MAIFKCKMCGAPINITEGQKTAECDYCLSLQTLPKFKSASCNAWYERANHFRRNNEFDKASALYEQILNEDTTDSEAYWSLVLCRYGIEYVEDPATKKRIPTVNRAQFTSIFDDENYISALRYADAEQKTLYEQEAHTINEIQKGILAISQKEDPFDVFICYKETDETGRRTPDSVLAGELYHQLVGAGYKVFFSRITLEDKLGSAYEPYIFAALQSAKVMVVIGTKKEYFDAVWVKNEWSRFLSLVKQSGGKKILIPAYRDMDPYDLPEEFSHLQAQDMSKLGFMQDLIRGIEKLMDPKPSVKESPAPSASGNEIAPLLRRIAIYLEDGEWQNANEYCERVLDKDPENAEAYLGKLLSELSCHNKAELSRLAQPFDQNHMYAKVLRFGNDALKSELKEYNRAINVRIANEKFDAVYRQAVQQQKNNTVESLAQARQLFLSIPDWKDSKQRADDCETQRITVRNENIYKNAAQLQAQGSSDSLEKAQKLFLSIPDWKDSRQRADDCETQRITLRNEGIYKNAAQLQAQGSSDSLEKAQQLFLSISNWKDAKQRVDDCLKERTYLVGVFQQKKDTVESLEKAKQIFLSISNWKDAEALAEKCQARIEQILAHQKQLELAKQCKAEKKKRRKKVLLILTALLLIGAIGAGAIFFLIDHAFSGGSDPDVSESASEASASKEPIEAKKNTSNINLARKAKVSGAKPSANPEISVYNASLNDGKAALELNASNVSDWFAYYCNTEGGEATGFNVDSDTKIGTAVLTLADAYEITKVRVHLFTGNMWGVSAPEYVRVSVSYDGTNYTEVETKTFKSDYPDDTNLSEWAEFTCKDLPRNTSRWKSSCKVCLHSSTRSKCIKRTYTSSGDPNGSPVFCVDFKPYHSKAKRRQSIALPACFL